ncbi:MAG TPA: molybdopterin molybdotransferase MoeA [Bacteroidales bacterium]|nr:molybdopterin molybdotransferase MoeA [Bacteroidales bacterium]HQB56176.1 molybdopterin molybdotransferase MoeA [Bacteroidales bacterium]
MIDFHDALNIVLNHAVPVGTEEIALTDACERVLAFDVFAPEDIPSFSKSAMDGYACRREDMLLGMKVLEVIPAGYRPQHRITPGTCSKIMTGAMVPEGANAILTVENATIRDGLVYGTPPQKSHIMVQGEDMKKGDRMLEKGTILNPRHLALLASCGIDRVTVGRCIRTGILSTGNELIEAGEVAEPGKVFNSNSWQLISMVNRSNGIPTYYGIAADTKEDTCRLLSQAIKENQVVILTGGVSEGDFDLVPVVIRELGFRILFDRVRIQPGKPTTFAVSPKSGKFIFGLPGNPVSSFVQCLLFVKPFLAALQGARWEPLSTHLTMKGDYQRRNSSRMAHIPLQINPDGTVSPLPYHGSAHQASLTKAHALGRIPVGVDRICDGETMEILLIE